MRMLCIASSGRARNAKAMVATRFVVSAVSVLFVSASAEASDVSQPVLRTTLPASWDENWFGSPAVYDLDGDGAAEIIAGRHSVVYVWDNHGEMLWSAPVGQDGSLGERHGSERQYAAPVVGDLDNDGNGEIAVGFGNNVAIYDHEGRVMAGWPQTFPGPDGEIRSIAGADLDDDGTIEILAVKTSTGPVTMAWHVDGTEVGGWPQVNRSECSECNDFGGYNQNIGATDLDGDGVVEVVSTYDICHIGIMYADGRPYPAHSMFSAAGPWASSVPMFHDIDLARQGWGADMNDRDEFTDSPPCFGDIDGDGVAEIVVYSDHERAGEYVNRGNCLWVLNGDMTRADGFETPICSGEPLYTGYENNIVQVCPAAAVAHFRGDSRPEIVVPSYDGRMRCYYADGSELWSYTFDVAGDPFMGASGAVVGDLNADGVCEVIFTTYSTQEDVSSLVILNASGKELHKVALSGYGSMSPPTIADIDGDEMLELVISLKRVLQGNGVGGVQVWDIASAQKGYVAWPTGRGNNLRDGNASAGGGEGAIDGRCMARPAVHDTSDKLVFNTRGQLVRAMQDNSLAAQQRKDGVVRSFTTTSKGHPLVMLHHQDRRRKP